MPADRVTAEDVIEAADPRITLGYRAHFPNIEVKVLGRGESAAEAKEAAEQAADEVVRRLRRIDEDGVVYGGRGDTLASALGAALKDKGWTLATAESCTGGLVGSLITSVPGSSAWFRGGVVAYANDMKEKVLRVRRETLTTQGAVSEACAREMAEGALALSGADLAVSITGIAGPDGGTADRPVGTVCFGLASRHDKTRTEQRALPGDRDRVRTLAAWVAMTHVLRAARGAKEF